MSKESALTSLNIPGAVDSSSVPSAAPDQLVASKDASSSEMETINSDPEITVTNSRIDFLARRNANVNFKLKDLLPDSVEELLGSVTFAPIRSGSSSSTNSGPVRTSARVIQKMRQDNRPSTPPPSNLSNGGPGGTGANCGSGVGSENTTKSDKVPNAPKTPTQSRNHIHGSGVVTSKRLWSNIERSLFFEALNEYGKDFDAIAQHINQKMRRKVLGTETSCKSREQVRHMYLQTFQKVSKYLRFSEDVKRVPQELYALINYGEMRRKLPYMHEKAFIKLKELVYRGSVTIREKGKTIRIRTPSCRALKKLNQLEEWQEEVTLPQRIEISLVPANMVSWGRVQSLAQNPRIKTSLPLHKRVSCLLKYLQNKWRSQEMRLCEKTMSYQPLATSSRSKTNQKNSNLPQMPILGNQDLIEDLTNCEHLLCFAPPAKTIIHRPMVNFTDFSNSYSICLNSYEDRIGAKCRGEELPVEKVITQKERVTNGKRLRLDSGGEGSSGSGVTPGTGKKLSTGEKKSKGDSPQLSNSDGETNKSETETRTTAIDALNSEEETALPSSVDIQMLDFSVITDSDKLVAVAGADRIDLFSDNSEDKKLNSKSDTEDVTPPVVNTTVGTGGVGAKATTTTSAKRSKGDGKGSIKAASFKPLISDDVIRKIKEGWTLDTCGDLTFGDLYVMFGNDFKVNLEYRWIEKERSAEDTVVAVVKEDVTAGDQVMKIDAVPEVDPHMEQILGRRLSQLLMIASMMDKSTRKDCTCDRGVKMKENDYPFPDSNLFKHPALPLRYSHYNGYNTMLQLRRLKPRQVHPFPTPKPYNMSAPKYYQSGRPSYTRPILPPLQDEAGRDGDAEDDGDEGTSGTSNYTEMVASAKSNDKLAEVSSPAIVERIPVAVQTSLSPPSSVPETTGSTTDMVSISDRTSPRLTEDDNDYDEGEEDEDEDYDEEDYSKNPGLLSLLEISLPSIRGVDDSRSGQSANNRQAWLEDNINDYSFSSLLGHIDMHLNSASERESETGSSSSTSMLGVAVVEAGADKGTFGMSSSQSSVPTGTMSVTSPNSVIRHDLMSDRCSVISETSVDFVNKFAELAEMIQDH